MEGKITKLQKTLFVQYTQKYILNEKKLVSNYQKHSQVTYNIYKIKHMFNFACKNCKKIACKLQNYEINTYNNS